MFKRKRGIAFVLMLPFMLSSGTAEAFGEDKYPENIVCTHVHDKSCGYMEGTDEIPCNMGCAETDENGVLIHDADCAYKEETQAVDCTHQHDSDCLPQPADGGQEEDDNKFKACALTDGCTLEDGHFGECSTKKKDETVEKCLCSPEAGEDELHTNEECPYYEGEALKELEQKNTLIMPVSEGGINLTVTSSPASGSVVEFASIQKALDSLGDVGGDVTITVEKAGSEKVTVPSDKGITSLTITSALTDKVFDTIYANGVPFSLNAAASTVYGGGNMTDVESGGTSVTIEKDAVVSIVYGGGYNGNVSGDVSIEFHGKTSGTGGIYGGGYAFAYGAYPNVTANVRGNIDINVSKETSVGFVSGGGNAYLETAANGGFAEANVTGKVSVFVDSENITSSNPFTGGGKITAFPAGGRVTANIKGDVEINIGENAKTDGSSWYLYGGGYAKLNFAGDDVEGEANVEGNITINALKNAYAGGYSQESTFMRFYGGGGCEGNNSPAGTANVTGNIYINTVRRCIESNGGLFGGGYAKFGTANVYGNTTVEVSPAPGQINDYESAKGVIGGGEAAFNGTATVSGNTKIIIHSGTKFESDAEASITGGGWASVGNGNANVGGNVTIEIDGGVRLLNKFIGGGYVKGSNSTANVGGTITTKLGDGFNIFGYTSFYGGGLVNKNGTGMSSATAGAVSTTMGNNCTLWGTYAGGGAVLAEGGDASVSGSVTTVIGDNFNNNSGGIYGGGWVSAKDGKATSGSVSTTLGNKCTLKTKPFTGGGVVEAEGGDASVAGSIKTVIGDGYTNTTHWFYSGGMIWNANGVAKAGSISTTIGKNCNLTGQQFIGGGAVEANDSDASVTGSITTQIGEGFQCGYFTAAGRAVTGSNSKATVGSVSAPASVSTEFAGSGSGTASFSGFLIGGGRTYIDGSDATVFGDTSLTFDGVVTDKNAYAGGYAGAAADASVTGTAAMTVKNITSAFSSAVFGGGYSGSDKGIADVENTSLVFENITNMAGWIYGGGYAADNAQASARVKEGVSVKVSDSNLYFLLLGGATAGSGHVEIAEKAVLSSDRSSIAFLSAGGNYDTKTDYRHVNEAEINLFDTTVANQIYAAGYKNANIGEVTVNTKGTVKTGSITVGTNSSLADKFTVNVGDGTTASETKIGYIYTGKRSLGHIYNNATLIHEANGNRLFWDLTDLQVDEGGRLALASFDESIAGNYTGGGTIAMNADKTFTVGGEVSGATDVELSGEPVIGKVYIQAAKGSTGDFTLKSDTLSFTKAVLDAYAQWSISDKPQGVTVTVVNDGGHGTVEPSHEAAIAPGGSQVFTFTPDYGYKLAALEIRKGTETINVIEEVAGDTFTMTYPSEACELVVAFMPMEKNDMENIVEKLPEKPLPGESLPEREQETILDAKLHYENLPEETKNTLPDKVLSDLNEALVQLPNVAVEVKVEVIGGNDKACDVPDAHMLLQSMTSEEAEGLKPGGDITEFKLSMIVSEAGSLSSEQEEALKNELNGAEEGKKFDVLVRKNITDGKGERTETLPRLNYPVSLVFDVADQQPPTGYQREWWAVNLHGDADKPQVYILKDEDNDNKTVTVSSSLFSVYTLIYRDTEKGSSAGSASGGSSTSYTVTAKAGEGGKISPDGKVRVTGGSNKTFIFTPLEGYEVAEVFADGESVGKTDTYTFSKVKENHTIEVLFRETEQSEETQWNAFDDVGVSDWFYDSVRFVFEKGLMSGISTRMFSPQMNTDRGMIVTILWRLEGSPRASGNSHFADVSENAYYGQAVKWAVENGIVMGYGDGFFGPDDSVTREQLASILYRYAAYRKYDMSAAGSLSDFKDAALVSGWARKQMQWAVTKGLISGRDNGTLDAGGLATRAEAAAILMRFYESVKE